MGYYPSIKVSLFINAAWKDISSDIVSDIQGSWGIADNGFLDRVASTGSLKFTLNNSDSNSGGMQGYYTPNKLGSLGIKKGLPVKVVFSYEDEHFTRFKGYISALVPSVDSEKRVEVECVDWLDYASSYPIVLPEIQYLKDIGQVVEITINQMGKQPDNTLYFSGSQVFPTVFDTVKANSRAMSEFGALANSELGFIYLKKDKDFGETLVVEGKDTRANSELTKFESFKNASAQLLTEAGEGFILEDGSLLVMNELYTVDFDNNMQNLDITHGKNQYNFISSKVYPRKVDSVESILFKLDSPLFIAAGQTISGIVGKYSDPTGNNNKITGKDMVLPALSDFQMWTNQNATGTDLSNQLSVTAVYGSEAVSYTVKNNSSLDGYITLLQARGKAVTLYNPVEYVISDVASITEFGYSSISIDQKYKDSTTTSDYSSILSRYKNPQIEVNSIDFIANRDEQILGAFLNCDIGQKIHIRESQNGIDDYFFINSVSFTATKGGIVYFTWGLRDAFIPA